jgi:hypothetical protein
MNDSTREKLLKMALVVFGAIFFVISSAWGGIAEQTDPAKDGTRHHDIDDRLQVRIGRGRYKCCELWMHLASREIDQIPNDHVGRAADG